MDESGYDDPLDIGGERDQEAASVISIEQLQRLVQLIDASDVSELELEQASEGIHLVLRKARAADVSPEASTSPVMVAPAQAATTSATPASAKEEPKEYTISAPLVGTFHVWAKPKGGALVAVGDHVKVGQLVGTIQSLNVLNEVETNVAGRVVKMHVQDGQPVEYGQILMTIDSSDGAKGA